MSQRLTETQLALRDAFFAADNELTALSDKKPIKPEKPSPLELVAYVEANVDFRNKWLAAVGFRDGLQRACQIAGIQGFEASHPIT